MLMDVHGKPEQHVLEQLGIRTMAKAKYATENIGHYGLVSKIIAILLPLFVAILM